MRSFIVLTLVFAARVAAAGTYDIHPGDDLYGRLGMLQAGDEVIVHAGTYMTPGYLSYTWAGTAGAPITIRAADGDRPTLVGTFAQNTFNVSGSYWTLRGFEIKGGSHGIRLAANDHVTLEDLVIHDVGDVGISCNFGTNNCDQIVIRHNEIYNTGKDTNATGEGLYLGCNDGSCVMTNSIVENNYIHDMDGDQGDGIEVKTGSYGNTVRDNVIVRSKYPGITMYGYSGDGPRNVVERNLVWHVTVDAGIQTVGQVVVRNNIVIDTVSYGIFSKPSNGFEPHDIEIVHNTVVNGTAAPCLRTSNWGTLPNQLIANNAFYCEGGTAMELNDGAPNATKTNNIVRGTAGADATPGVSVAADLGDPMSSVYPPVGSALIDAGGPAQTAGVDFNGTARDASPDVGAYEHTAPTNPGWMLAEDFKGALSVQPDGAPVTGGDGTTDEPGDGGCCSTGARPSDALFGVLVLGGVLRRRRRARRA